MMNILTSVTHPDELIALVKYKLGKCKSVVSKHDYSKMSANMKQCYDLLNSTSRSFAAVIQALDGELRDAICIFYLVLRALDTIEDDMKIPNDQKIPVLREFHTYLQDPEWKYTSSQEKDGQVLTQFPVISAEFRRLQPVYCDIISDICRRMGEGMTIYLDTVPNTLQDWDQYCHYVAGLVGVGLSQLFSASGLEDPQVGEDLALSNSMGLFLQKTNIIRDYLEDVLQDRLFWPKIVWNKYAAEMIDLSKPEKKSDALACLNELVCNALQHVPDVINYMGRIKNQSVFNFCAIPQVMAIATLERCYNNYSVFTSVVKIRKGEAVRMMMESTDLDSVRAIMTHFLTKIKRRMPVTDPNYTETRKHIEVGLAVCRTNKQFTLTAMPFPILYMSCSILIVAIVWQYSTGISKLLSVS